ncbi:hypothetical protein DFP72DRAFT_1169884 [Ephemerocybe angulata]|uniref:Uncharacterized protein n=1 Tax=Ephemerocybe angulata TaxID=980116 RepID=A0A8H6M4Z6_9AGAR|nr:hypothetical protein DFP72DRAFT_1169884 [Tulosesus angulatus]
MSSTSQYYTATTPAPDNIHTKTTLTADLTTVLTTESVFTSNGKTVTTTIHIATVLQSGTEVINQESTVPDSPNKPNTIVIVGAAVGGTLGIVLIVAAIFFFRRRRRKQPQRIAPSPTQGYVAPIPPATLTPFNGYQSPEHAQPYHHESLIVNEGSNVVMYPPQPMSEKRQRSALQHRTSGGPPQHASRPSIDEGSIASQPYTTTSSGYSMGGAPMTSGGPPLVTVRTNQPYHQHQRSLSATSDMQSIRSDTRSIGGGNPTGASPTPGHTPAPSYFPGPGGAMGALPEESEGSHHYPGPRPSQDGGYPASTGSNNRLSMGMASGPPAGGPQYQYPQGYQQPQHQRSYHAQPPTMGAGGSSSGGGWQGGTSGPGGSATVDRVDGRGAQVVAAKNSASVRNMRGDDVNDSVVNLSELPPTYDSLQQGR